MFDQAKLAVVAYGQVSYLDGSSTKTNSGVVTTRIGLGTYQISLPVASQNQLGLQQFSDRDPIFVQPLAADFPISSSAVNNGDQDRQARVSGFERDDGCGCGLRVHHPAHADPAHGGGPA